MAKKRKYPKEPKRSASLETWRNYRDKVKEVDKYNAALEKRKQAKERVIADAKRLKTR